MREYLGRVRNVVVYNIQHHKWVPSVHHPFNILHDSHAKKETKKVKNMHIKYEVRDDARWMPIYSVCSWTKRSLSADPLPRLENNHVKWFFFFQYFLALALSNLLDFRCRYLSSEPPPRLENDHVNLFFFFQNFLAISILLDFRCRYLA